jgi:hypothetical protein
MFNAQVPCGLTHSVSYRRCESRLGETTRRKGNSVDQETAPAQAEETLTAAPLYN